MYCCRTCASTALEDFGSSSPSLYNINNSPDFSRIVRCSVCNLVQRRAIPSDSELLGMYRSETADILEYEATHNAAWQAALKFIDRSSSSRLHLLDIGCHTGKFLSLTPSYVKRYGIEADGAPSRYARLNNSVQIIAERVESASEEFNHVFDMVLMFDVLEHLANPAEGLLSALKLVKPGGRLIFSTADADTWPWSLLGAQHWYLQTGQHLSVLSRSYVRYLERRHGLTVERIMRIPHTHSGLRVRFRQFLELLHWANLNRPLPWRLLSRLLQEVPGFRAIRHRQTVPWAMSLQDHMFVAIRSAK